MVKQPLPAWRAPVSSTVTNGAPASPARSTASSSALKVSSLAPAPGGDVGERARLNLARLAGGEDRQPAGYCNGAYSSRRIAKAYRERVDFMSIVGLDPPDFRTISEFRKRHLNALSALFGQVLRLR